MSRGNHTREETTNTSSSSEDNITNANSNTIGLNKNILRVIAIFGSLCIGLILGLWSLIQGNIILAGMFFLVGSGIPFLLAMIEGDLRESVHGNAKSSRKNKSTSSTKQCPDCGWHNHQANNNCIECGKTFVGRSDHRETNNSKQICSDCGWQNPPDNSYCIDCGTTINE